MGQKRAPGTGGQPTTAQASGTEMGVTLKDYIESKPGKPRRSPGVGEIMLTPGDLVFVNKA